MPVSIRHTHDGSFAPSEHLEFVKNRERNRAFRRAIEQQAAGKVVMDIGTGSGLQAIYAARAGARRVIAVEKDEKMARIARHNFERNGLSNKIDLLVTDAMSLDREKVEDVELVIGELLST